MTGTEKQISWAEDIINEAIHSFDNDLKEEDKYLQYCTSEESIMRFSDRYEIYSMAAEIIKNVIVILGDDAANIINNRDKINVAVTRLKDMTNEINMSPERIEKTKENVKREYDSICEYVKSLKK